MQELPVKLDIIAVIIFLGIFLGFYISFFFIKKSLNKNTPNLFMGFFLLSVCMIMLEGWLNYTNYIFDVLWLSNFSEPLNFVIAPLIYLFVAKQLGDKKSRKDLLHFVPFVLWLIYSMYFFLQSTNFKYNAAIDAMRLDLPLKIVNQSFSDNPLKIRQFVNELTILQLLFYFGFIIYRLLKKVKTIGQTIMNTTNTTLKSLRNSLIHFFILLFILIIVKLIYKDDVGDYMFFLYLSFMIFMTTYQIINESSYFTKPSTFLESPVLKYRKSSLNEEHKEQILNGIINLMKNEKYFLNSTASLSGIAKSINESSHHVSQVINEKLNQSFFELLATYRVEEAKAILKTELGKKLTIEEIAEQVGYNSKSAFNTSFKKITSQTPSEFRDL